MGLDSGKAGEVKQEIVPFGAQLCVKRWEEVYNLRKKCGSVTFQNQEPKQNRFQFGATNMKARSTTHEVSGRLSRDFSFILLEEVPGSLYFHST